MSPYNFREHTPKRSWETISGFQINPFNSVFQRFEAAAYRKPVACSPQNRSQTPEIWYVSGDLFQNSVAGISKAFTNITETCIADGLETRCVNSRNMLRGLLETRCGDLGSMRQESPETPTGCHNGIKEGILLRRAKN